MRASISKRRGSKTSDLNRRRAIRDRCLDCSGWIVSEVSNCEIKDCPLYRYRSGRGKQDPQKRAKAIRSYCLSCMNGQSKEVRLCPSHDCSLYPYRILRIDRAAKIDPASENDHMDVNFSEKTKSPYLSIA